MDGETKGELSLCCHLVGHGGRSQFACAVSMALPTEQSHWDKVLNVFKRVSVQHFTFLERLILLLFEGFNSVQQKSYLTPSLC